MSDKKERITLFLFNMLSTIQTYCDKTKKQIYANRIKIIQLRKSISCQQYFENTGKYPLNACYLPSICGMIDIMRSKKFVK